MQLIWQLKMAAKEMFIPYFWLLSIFKMAVQNFPSGILRNI